MSELAFRQLCINLIKNYLNKDEDYAIYVAWQCKVLQNNKALLSTNLKDGMYYEITYNGDKNEVYFDAYKKFENRCISL